ncbi:Adrenodoxin-like protein 1 [Cardamine amara subsp. amara]|uniref:Adrenodoxin-like protein 1 n=1 Tax=Cardamine amara subsp. amara TaxID=228776 RepID=A0ABD1B7W4_CARAN
MLGHRISRFGSAIVKQLAREGYLSTFGTRNLQRSYGQYLPSSTVVPRQARTSQEAWFLKSHMFCTSSTTSSSENGDETTEK